MKKDLRETTLSSELAWQGGFIKVRRDQAQLPDGSTGVREYVVHPGAAAMVPIFDDQRVLIERQFRYPLQRTFIEFPAGKLDPGEHSLQTARRELLEETGYIARQWALLTTIHPAIGFASEVIDIYLCRELTHVQQQLDAGEFMEIEVVTLGWLMDELKAGRLSDVKTQIAVHWLEKIYAGQWAWPAFEVHE